MLDGAGSGHVRTCPRRRSHRGFVPAVTLFDPQRADEMHEVRLPTDPSGCAARGFPHQDTRNAFQRCASVRGHRAVEVDGDARQPAFRDQLPVIDDLRARSSANEGSHPSAARERFMDHPPGSGPLPGALILQAVAIGAFDHQHTSTSRSGSGSRISGRFLRPRSIAKATRTLRPFLPQGEGRQGGAENVAGVAKQNLLAGAASMVSP
jgi:hypothetical protein